MFLDYVNKDKEADEKLNLTEFHKTINNKCNQLRSKLEVEEKTEKPTNEEIEDRTEDNKIQHIKEKEATFRIDLTKEEKQEDKRNENRKQNEDIVARIDLTADNGSNSTSTKDNEEFLDFTNFETDVRNTIGENPESTSKRTSPENLLEIKRVENVSRIAAGFKKQNNIESRNRSLREKSSSSRERIYLDSVKERIDDGKFFKERSRENSRLKFKSRRSRSRDSSYRKFIIERKSRDCGQREYSRRTRSYSRRSRKSHDSEKNKSRSRSRVRRSRSRGKYFTSDRYFTKNNGRRSRESSRGIRNRGKYDKYENRSRY